MKTTISPNRLVKNLLLTVSIIISTSWTVQAQNPITVENTTGPNACDGYAYLDSAFADLPIIWTSNALGISFASNTFVVENLCPGDYVVTFNSNGGNITVPFIVGSGGNPNPCAGFTASMSTTETILNGCTGSAFITVHGGTTPYTFSCSAGAINGVIQLTDLCVGPISCYVTDANGCSTEASGYIFEDNNGGGTPNDTIIVILNNTFPPNSVTDSLTTTSILDCNIDFDSIGSASITNVQQSPTGILVTWTIYDFNGSVMTTYDIPYMNVGTNAGIYQATLIIVCGRSINEVHITDQFEYTPSASEIIEETLLQFNIVNPIQDILAVQFNEKTEGQLTLVDIKGSQIFSKSIQDNQFQYNASDLKLGVYLLQIRTNRGVSVVKLLK